MRIKILNILLILTSLIGYLEWGKNNHTFLFQAEWVVLTLLVSKPMSVLHPFTVLPLLGQLLLCTTLFQKTPSKILSIIGMGCLLLLLGFVFVVGTLAMNVKIMGFALPFLIFSGISIWHLRKIQ